MTDGAEEAREKFGGVNLGTAFFGWLVAVGVVVIPASVVAAGAAAVRETQNITRNDLDQRAGTLGLASAAALVVITVIGYYAGGYVAGRMSRFDGGRQGVVTWVIGLTVAVAAVPAGWLVDRAYDLRDRVDLPHDTIPNGQLAMGAIVTGAVILVGTLLAATAGGRIGQRYHRRVDEYATD